MSIPARARSLDKRFYGVVEGLVSDNLDPDHEGRIKVTFPWFDGGEMVSEWCRVRQLYAGNGYGTFFVPEVGDEVLIAFVHGDMRLPMVLGGLFNGLDKPPSWRARDKDQKLIRTKGEHEILLDDSSNKKRIRLKTAGGHSADLSDCDHKIEIRTSGGHLITLDDSGRAVSIQTSGGHRLEMTDQGQAVSIQTSGGLVARMDDAAQSISLMTPGATAILDGAAGAITLAAQTITLAGSSIVLGAPNVAIGSAASHPLVLGDTLLVSFNAHLHTSATPGAPTSPPITPLTPAVLSAIGKTG